MKYNLYETSISLCLIKRFLLPECPYFFATKIQCSSEGFNYPDTNTQSRDTSSLTIVTRSIFEIRVPNFYDVYPNMISLNW